LLPIEGVGVEERVKGPRCRNSILRAYDPVVGVFVFRGTPC
jgi:hypothetical protein